MAMAMKSNKKTIRDHIRPHKTIQDNHGNSIPLCSLCNWDFVTLFWLMYRNIFCSLGYFLFPCTIFVRFGTFFPHVSTPRPRTRTRTTTTTKLLLGPLSGACGQKMFFFFFCVIHFKGCSTNFASMTEVKFEGLPWLQK